MCIAKNYFEHAKEMGATSVPPHPVIFQKPLSSVLKEGEKIVIPANIECHHEVELAVLIGKEGKSIKRSDASKYIAGYCLALDLTARNVQADAKKNSWPWDISKGFDTFLPLSSLVLADQIPDPYCLDIEFLINGVIKQKGTTGDMHYKIDEIIEYISNAFTLVPGDLILTGTPAGVGPIHGGDHLKMHLKRSGKILVEADFHVEK